ncbi:cysteine rich repeat-containing protein [Ancylobacter aquaticus]|nr:cysteine rich repeat-containing protein [Ancylobacter aquaticus]
MRAIIMGLSLFMALAAGNAAQAQQNDLVKYCQADIQRLCPAVQPGGGRIMKCLKAHTKEMSVGCAQALQKMKG